MKRSLVGGRIAEEADGEPVLAPVSGRKGHPRGERYLSSDDAMPTVEEVLDVKQVHRAPFPFAVASASSEQLRHHHPGIGVSSERVAVISIGGQDEIIGSNRFHCSDCNRLLADVQVAEAGDLRQAILLARAFLEAADQHHLSVHRQ